jgi:hypothetical protein
MSELWVPGAVSVEDFVARVQQQAARFAADNGGGAAMVEVELRDGSLYKLDTLSAEPGHGFVTLRPHPEEKGEREEFIVPLASVASIRISMAEPEREVGFAPPP